MLAKIGRICSWNGCSETWALNLSRRDPVSALALQVRTEAGNFDLSNDGDRWLLFQACIKAADLAHTATRWEQHRRWTECLCEEFYKQVRPI